MKLSNYYSQGRGVLFRSFLRFKYNQNYSDEIPKDWVTYQFLRDKYSTFINELPLYKEEKSRKDIIWWNWFPGEENAPQLNKSCLASIRKYAKNKKIIVIDRNNMDDYVSFPSYIIEKYKKGIIPRGHFTDLLRLELLTKYGGTWIDASVLLTGYNKDFFDSDFFVFKNYKKAIVISSWFITANKNNPILRTTKDILYDYWKHNNFFLHYFLFHICFSLSYEKYPDIWKKVPEYSNVEPHLMQKELLNKYDKKRFNELKKISSVHKLSNHIKSKDVLDDSLYSYIEKMYK